MDFDENTTAFRTRNNDKLKINLPDNTKESETSSFDTDANSRNSPNASIRVCEADGEYDDDYEPLIPMDDDDTSTRTSDIWLDICVNEQKSNEKVQRWLGLSPVSNAETAREKEKNNIRKFKQCGGILTDIVPKRHVKKALSEGCNPIDTGSTGNRKWRFFPDFHDDEEDKRMRELTNRYNHLHLNHICSNPNVVEERERVCESYAQLDIPSQKVVECKESKRKKGRAVFSYFSKFLRKNKYKLVSKP